MTLSVIRMTTKTKNDMDEIRKLKGSSIYYLKKEIEERAKEYIKWNNSYISYDDDIIFEKLVNIGLCKIDGGLWFYDRWEASMRSDLEQITGIKYSSIDDAIKNIWKSSLPESENSYRNVRVYDHALKHSSKMFRFLSSRFVQYAARILLTIISVVFLFEVIADGLDIGDSSIGVIFILIISWTPIILIDSFEKKHHALIPLLLYISMMLSVVLKTIFFSHTVGAYNCVDSIHKAAWFFPIILLTPIFYFDKREYYTKEKVRCRQ